MRQKIHRSLFLASSMSTLLFVVDQMIPLVQPALATTGQGTISTAAQLTSSMRSQPSLVPMGVLVSERSGPIPLAAPPVLLPTPPSPRPAIGVSSRSLSLSAQQGDSSPTTQTLTVTNIGRGTLSWNAAATAAWLALSPASGKDTGTITLTATAGSLAKGTYNTTIILSAAGATPVSIPVTFAVTEPEVTLTASPSGMTYTATQGAANPSPQSIAISANGTWTASDGASWLSINPTSGSNNGTITASVNTATAILGDNSTAITLKSGGLTRTVNVTLRLNPPASSSATLTWRANTESDLAGYRVYRATSSGTYGAPIATIQGNTPNYIATGLQIGTTYFFVVTAFDTAGNESAYSNEVSKSIF